MDIVPNPDGTLVVPIPPARSHDDDDTETGDAAGGDVTDAPAEVLTSVLHPGKGGDVLPAHEATKIIGEVLAELD